MKQSKYENKLEAVMISINDYVHANSDLVFSHQDLADKVGISRQAIAKIYHQESTPSYLTAQRIHKAINEQLTKYGQNPIELEELFPVPELPPEEKSIYAGLSIYSL